MSDQCLMPFAIKQKEFFLSFRHSRQIIKDYVVQVKTCYKITLILNCVNSQIIISEERCICDICLVILMMKNKYVFPSADFRYIRFFY